MRFNRPALFAVNTFVAVANTKRETPSPIFLIGQSYTLLINCKTFFPAFTCVPARFPGNTQLGRSTLALSRFFSTSGHCWPGIPAQRKRPPKILRKVWTSLLWSWSQKIRYPAKKKFTYRWLPSVCRYIYNIMHYQYNYSYYNNNYYYVITDR